MLVTRRARCLRFASDVTDGLMLRLASMNRDTHAIFVIAHGSDEGTILWKMNGQLDNETISTNFLRHLHHRLDHFVLYTCYGLVDPEWTKGVTKNIGTVYGATGEVRPTFTAWNSLSRFPGQ